MAKRVSHDDIDKFFEYGLDIKNRTIYIGSVDRLGDDDEEDGSGTDFRMAEKALKALHLLEADAPKGDQPITIIMNNAGGSEYHGMAIYDAIKSCRNEVTIKIYGMAMSMGSLILQAADRRAMAPNSRFMIHYGAWGTNDHPKITYKHAEEGKRWDVVFEELYLAAMAKKDAQMIDAGQPEFLQKLLSDMVNRFNQILSHSPKKTVKYRFSEDPSRRKEDMRAALQDLLDFDTYLTPEETIALGFADEILVPYAL